MSISATTVTSDDLCSLYGRCGGCGWGGRPLGEQHEIKLAQVRSLFEKARLVYTPALRVRDRADLIWRKQNDQSVLGLYALNSSSDREVVDLEICPMMSPKLEEWLRDFRKLVPPIELGSVRLRVSPSGERGVWLDYANADVKRLFDEREYLRALSKMGFVEIGQRRKALEWRDDAPKLVDAVLRPWFETYDGEFHPLPLYGPVGGFTQTGFAANRALIRAVSELVALSSVNDWVELFCGNGNFTLALAARGQKVEAVEMDALALAGLERSLELAPQLRERIRLSRADVYLKTKTLPGLAGRGLLVDPPRAGMRELLTVLRAGERPAAIVYVSCFADVFVRDMQELKAMGFVVRDLIGIDQFPQSPHCEWVALLT